MYARKCIPEWRSKPVLSWSVAHRTVLSWLAKVALVWWAKPFPPKPQFLTWHEPISGGIHGAFQRLLVIHWNILIESLPYKLAYLAPPQHLCLRVCCFLFFTVATIENKQHDQDFLKVAVIFLCKEYNKYHSVNFGEYQTCKLCLLSWVINKKQWISIFEVLSLTRPGFEPGSNEVLSILLLKSCNWVIVIKFDNLDLFE